MLCMCVAGKYSPKKSSKTKYSQKVRGGFSAASFRDYRLPTSIVTALVNASNQSLSLNSWSSYKTAESHLKKCESETGVRMRFPMTDRSQGYFDKLKLK